jgi:hypothetical protein
LASEFFSTTALRQAPPPSNDDDGEDRDIDLVTEAPSQGTALVINLPDGSVEVSLGAPEPATDIHHAEFDANLAEHLSSEQLSALAEDLLRGIEEDENSRKEWLKDRAEGMKLLALKVEPPTSDSGSSAAGQTNLSRTRHTLLLEAVLRGQANAYGEFLPAEGPVKVSSKMARQTVEGDELAQELEDDFNYYLTETATEYYPDTDRMFFWIYFGGIGLKKVYRCPIRRRPVSESIDVEDLIISNQATDIMNADRVTLRVKMTQSTMKRMKALRVYRDAALEQPSPSLNANAVDQEKQAITGIAPPTRPEDAPYELYESSWMTDIPGDEHKEGNEISGIPRPYKVTVDPYSRQILEIRRNWKKGDPLERRRRMIVDFPMIRALGFYGIGLMHIVGNPTMAATALQRIMIDAGIYGNFPGFLFAKSATHQNTMDMNVPPGAGVPVDVSMTQDGDLRKAAMPLPYKEAGAGIMNLFKEITETGSRVGGAADIAVGEGRQDAPVGTTLALLDQATKIIDAVHKRLHKQQSTEIKLLRDLFLEYPEDFWKFNEDRDPNWDKDKLTRALKDYNLVPRSDPNTSSKTQRIMIAQALYLMASQHPEWFQLAKTFAFVLRTMGINNPDEIYQQPPPQSAPPDLKGQAAIQSAEAQQMGAQAKLIEAQTKSKTEGADIALRAQESRNDLAIQQMESADARLKARVDLQKDAMMQARDHQHEQAQQSREIAASQIEQARDQAHEQRMGLIGAMSKPQGQSGETSEKKS